MKISHIENANVYVAKGKTYRWINHLDRMAQEGNIFDTRMGWNFYVVGQATMMFKGTFKLEIWVEKGTANMYVDWLPKAPIAPKPEPIKNETDDAT
jgi:hypothetical protein